MQRIVEVARAVVRDLGPHHVGSFAATLAFRALFALFPFLVFVISLLGATRSLGVLRDGLDALAPSLPASAVTLLGDQIDRLSDARAGTFTVGAVVAALLALWGVSGAFRAIIESLNVMYERTESRGKVRVLVVSIGMSLGAVALFVTSLVLVVGGGALAEWLADETGVAALEWVWKLAQWPVLAALVLLAFGLIYHVAPDVELELRWITPGALLGLAAWLVFTLLFSLYVNNFGSYNETYGALAGVAVLMLYLYYAAYILLLGAEVNRIVRWRWSWRSARRWRALIP